MEGFEVRTSNSKKVNIMIFRKLSELKLLYPDFIIYFVFQGKGLFATRKFDQGDIILEEDPLVSCQFAWNAAYRYLACDHCMR